MQILMMVPYTHSNNITGYGDITYQQKETRMQEIVDSIQKTLNYDHTDCVYIFYQDPLLIPYMVKQNISYKEKLQFVPNMEDTMSTLFHYANEHLANKTVMIVNADTYPMEGFGQVNMTKLRTQKLVYLISRYGFSQEYAPDVIMSL